jgi:hypothetical protein
MTQKYTYALRSSNANFDGFTLTVLAKSREKADEQIEIYREMMQITDARFIKSKPYKPAKQ